MTGDGSFLLRSGSGLSAQVQPHGAVTWLSHDGGQLLRLNLYPASGLESGPANLWLRRLDGDAVRVHPLLGPASGSAVAARGDRGLTVSGSWDGVGCAAHLDLLAGAPTWAWQVVLTQGGAGARPIVVDVVLTQDVALAPPVAVRTNEYYVSQYLDVTPVEHAQHGPALAVRQNQPLDGPGAGRTPWLVLACVGGCAGWATDALQVYGHSRRDGTVPAGLLRRQLPSERLQHEHTLLALQSPAAVLAAGATRTVTFVGRYVADHPAPTGDADSAEVGNAVADLAVLLDDPPAGGGGDARPAVRTLFEPAQLFPARDLTDDEVRTHAGGPLAHEERAADGALLSGFVAPDDHLVLRRKELVVTRPHAHLLRTGAHLEPDERSLTTTAAMGGQLASYVTQGHVSRDRFLSVARSYLGLHRAAGLRVFVEDGGRWLLLDTPSAFRMRLAEASWLYRTDELAVEVTTVARTDAHAVDVTVRVTDGGPRRLLVAAHVGDDGDDGLQPGRPEAVVVGDTVEVRVRPASPLHARRPGGAFVLHLGDGARGAQVGDDGPLFADGVSRDLPWVTLQTAAVTQASVRIVGHLVPPGDPVPEPPGGFWPHLVDALQLYLPTEDLDPAADRLRHFLPWLLHDALVHYLAPRGIEQYTGGAWGTRDVCQGPVELLLALDRTDVLRSLLLRIFGAQAPDGGWPQAFEIHPVDAGYPNGDAHGDVIFWPVLALGRYLLATGDAGVLDEVVRFHEPDGTGEPATIRQHAARAVDRFTRLVVPGTHLSAYGHGDWNDSLQPADPALATRMSSSWTVTLHHQSLITYAAGLAAAGLGTEAEALRAAAAVVHDAFQATMLPDGVVAGYAVVDPDGQTRYLLHPRDRDTGLSYSLLPIIHALADDLLTPEQAHRHLQILDEHLLLPDGAHLFDRPPGYAGGRTTHFRRAETATFFGREIGTMYTHAHLRYLEAMCRVGRTDAAWLALEQVNPVGLTAVVPSARRRQATSYFSSSDACFPDRTSAAEHWDLARAGLVDDEGGWRVYSSGAGILVRLVVECLLGLRRRPDHLEIDPVLPARLDGLRVTLPVAGRPLTVRFAVGAVGHGATRVACDDTDLPITRLTNPYRTGGVRVAYQALAGRDAVDVTLP